VQELCTPIRDFQIVFAGWKLSDDRLAELVDAWMCLRKAVDHPTHLAASVRVLLASVHLPLHLSKLRNLLR